MGLDIYLHQYIASFEEIEAFYTKVRLDIDAMEEEIGRGRPFQDFTDEEKSEYFTRREQIRVRHGCSANGDLPVSMEKDITEKSKKHPDAYSNIGYIRSSYNPSGYDECCRRVLGNGGLTEIFDATGQWVFQPNWELSLGRALHHVTLWKGLATKPCFDVIESRHDLEAAVQIRSAKDAITLFTEKHDQYRFEEMQGHRSMSSYQNSHGIFRMKEPLQIMGVVHGITISEGEETPMAYLVYRSENMHQRSLQTAEIVVEMCEYVLAQPQPEQFYLLWSG